MSLPQIASAIAYGENWRDALDACLAALASPRGANLGFVYFSDHYAAHAEELLAALRRETGIADWVGSVAIGVCGRGDGAIDAGGISLLAGRFPAGSFRLFSGRRPLAGPAPYLAVVHADPHTPDMPELVADMAGKVTSGFITGGLSSARERTLQVAGDVLSGGISGVVFDQRVAIATRLTQGCSPFAGHHTITEAQRNIIATIDHRPALEVYREAVGEALADDLPRAAQFILVGLPVAGRETNDYLARHVVGIDPQNGLLAINELVEPGRALLFLRRDGDAARKDMRRMLQELRGALPSPPRGGLYFSCLGRGGHMFGEDAAEPELIGESFGDMPLAGFFCSGEISHDQLYGYTGVLTLFL